MWEEQKSRRFQELRRRQQENGLPEGEQAELASLTKELEDAEAVYLSPAVQQLRQERDVLENQNRNLENLLHRREALVRRLHDFLAETQAEHRAIARELTAVLTGGRGSEADD